MSLYTAAQYAALLDSWVGLPYVLGQPIPYNTPNPKAADCSGLIIAANIKSGAYVMGDDTAAGLYNRSKKLTGSPAVGDLVFLRNNPARSNGIGHVAVLTQKLSNGDWRIIEAKGRDYGVVRTTLSFWKTRKHYAGIRRLPGFKLASAPPPPKPTLAGVKLRVATLNCLDPRFKEGSGKLPAKARRDALVRVMKRAKADIYLLTECPEQIRFLLRDGLPGGRKRWLVWERGAQAILFDSQRLRHTGKSVPQVFGPTSYHGGVIAPLIDRASGRTVVVGAFHLPPDVVASKAKQDAFLDGFTAAMRKHSGTRIIGGDGMNTTVWAAGWVDSRTAAAASATRDKPTYKSSITDRIMSDSKTPVTWRGYTVHDSAAGSDHNLVVTAATIPAPSSL